MQNILTGLAQFSSQLNSCSCYCCIFNETHRETESSNTQILIFKDSREGGADRKKERERERALKHRNLILKDSRDRERENLKTVILKDSTEREREREGEGEREREKITPHHLKKRLGGGDGGGGREKIITHCKTTTSLKRGADVY